VGVRVGDHCVIRTGRYGKIASASDPDQEYVYFMGSETLLPSAYFPTNLVYPFTLRVTAIKAAVMIRS